MAGEGGDAEDRTEAPTPRRLAKAREEGQTALSKEAVGFATLLGASLAGAIALPPMTNGLLLSLRGLMANAHQADAASTLVALLQGLLLAVLPIAAGAAIAALLATFLQTGFLVRGSALEPKFSRMNPLSALKRMVGTEMLVELLRTLFKLGIVGAAVWHAVDIQAFDSALHLSTAQLLSLAGDMAMKLLTAALVAFALIAALDILWVRFKHNRDLSMSREDIREEMKETEGDPHIKGRQKQIRMQRARQRMMAQVPKATVVITNPTHYSVALAYEQGAQAPKLVAKGVDAMAFRIREVATEHGVPIVPNPPLARALYKLELDTEIPPEHWQAVAEIIAYVWRLKNQVAGAQNG